MKIDFNHLVSGWDNFLSWYKTLLNDTRLSADTRAYLKRRIIELVEDRVVSNGLLETKAFWNTCPIKLSFLWKWTDEDMGCGIEKASELEH